MTFFGMMAPVPRPGLTQEGREMALNIKVLERTYFWARVSFTASCVSAIASVLYLILKITS